MIDKYTLKITDTGAELLDHQGNVVWSDSGEVSYPNDDAIEAMLDDANIGNPQKALFATLFLGPERQDDRDHDDPS